MSDTGNQWLRWPLCSLREPQNSSGWNRPWKNLVHHFLWKGAYIILFSGLSNCILKPPETLRRLFHWMIVLTVKNVFLTLRWNLSSCHLDSSSLVFSMCLLVKKPLFSSQLDLVCLNTVIISLLSFLFYSEKGPNHFSLSHRARCLALWSSSPIKGILLMKPSLATGRIVFTGSCPAGGLQPPWHLLEK